MPYGIHRLEAQYYPSTVSIGNSSGFTWAEGVSYTRLGTNAPRARQNVLRVPYYVLVSRQVRGPWDGTFYWKRGKRFRNRPFITVLRLKRRYKKVYSVQSYRGSSPNVLSFKSCKRNAVPTEVTLKGRHRWQDWTFTGHPFADYSINGVGILGDIRQYVFPSSEVTVGHPGRQLAISELRESVVNKIYERLKSQDFNAAVTLAQVRETGETISDVAVRALKLALAVKRGDLSKATKVLKGLGGDRAAVSSSYLQYTYGIAPLIGDVQGALKAMKEIPALCNYVKVKAKESKTLSTHEYIVEDTNICTTKVLISEIVTVKYVAQYRVSNTISRDASLLGLTGFAPLEVGWELLPYSFVVDWFYPIGNYLESLSATAGLEIETVTETIFTRTNVKVFREFHESESQHDGSTQLTSGNESIGTQLTAYSCERKFSALTPPTLPALKNPFSGKHFLNAAALISQLIRGK